MGLLELIMDPKLELKRVPFKVHVNKAKNRSYLFREIIQPFVSGNGRVVDVFVAGKSGSVHAAHVVKGVGGEVTLVGGGKINQNYF